MTGINMLREMLALRPIEDVALSPDGSRVAVTVSENFSRPGAGWQARIWLAADGADAKQISSGPGADRLPRWSPDGSTIAFLSDRDSPGMHRIFLRTEATGESAVPAAINGSVEDIQWDRDGARLLALAADSGSDRAGTQAATKIEAAGASANDPVVRRSYSAWRRLFLVDVPDGTTRELPLPGRTAWEAHWSGASRVIAITSPDPTESGWYDIQLERLDIETGESASILDTSMQLQNPRVSPDGRHAAAVEAMCSDRGVLAGTPVIVNLESRAAIRSSLEDVVFLEWRDASTLWFCEWRGLGSRFGVLHVDGSVDEWWSGEETIGSRYALRVSATPDGSRIAAVIESAARPPEVAVFDGAPGKGSWRRITTFNEHIAALDLPKAERVTWTARDGLEIEGLLVRPSAAPAGPLPAVALIHGGPNVLWSNQFTNNVRMFILAAEGYAAFLPNPRGTLGRGAAFRDAVIGDFGGEDLQDTLAGIEALVARGVVDTRRVGIMGVSYGGFISAWAVTQTDRFAASIPLSCVSNFISQHYTSNIARFDEIYFGAKPREDPMAYLDRSPVHHVDGVRTPTLLISGDGDNITPPGQAIEMYQALIEAGCETELVLYPREGHYVIEWDHQFDFWQRVLGWFGRWMPAG